VRIVPFNTPTQVSDFGGPAYTETWLPGAFEKQTKAANRVWLNFEHEAGLGGIVGHGVELVERDDALYGTFRAHENADGDKALQLVNEGLLPGVSLEAIPLRSQQRNGIVERVRARLDKVSLCRFPAFDQARVLAVREGEPEEPAPEPEPEPEPVPAFHRNTDVDEMLSRIGYAPLASQAVTRKPWSGMASRYEDSEYERACLIDRGGDKSAKERCSFPVLEPDGMLNANALDHASRALVRASAPGRVPAARRLLRYYRQAGEEAPENLRALAAR